MPHVSQKLVYVPRKEFIRKIISGERDFAGIRLRDGTDLNYDDELARYLFSQNDFKTSPIILTGSQLRHVRAIGLHFPYVKARQTNLRGADLYQAYLVGADFRNASIKNATLSYSHLDHADLHYANLQGASCHNTIFFKANLENAVLESAFLTGASFADARLVYVKNLEDAFDLAKAYFDRVFVTEREKKIILDARKKAKKAHYNRKDSLERQDREDLEMALRLKPEFLIEH